MTVDEAPKDQGNYQVIILPKEHINTGKWVYQKWNTTHPVSNEPSSFLIANNKEDQSNKTLYILDKINWKNYNIKNLATTPDGKPYRCIFITKDEENEKLNEKDITSIVIGKSPDMYLMTPFSPLYLLLSYFKNFLQKSHNDETSNKRSSLYEDLLDSICENDEQMNILVNEYHLDIKPYLEKICDITAVPNMDSDDESESEFFFKLSIDKITEFLNTKIITLRNALSQPAQFESLKSRMDSFFPTTSATPDDIKLEMWTKQAITLIGLYVDQWYIDQLISKHNYSFEKMEKFINDSKSQLKAQEIITESFEQLHEGTVGVLSKKSKPNKQSNKSTTKKAPVKVKSGALDMFFKKKEK